MFKKTIFLLLTGFAFQFIISCCNPGPPSRFLLKPEAADAAVYQIRNDTLLVIDSAVARLDFRLITFINTKEIIDTANISLNLGGFSNAKACSDYDPIVEYTDLVQKLEIFTVDTLGNNRLDITSSFRVPYSNGYSNDIKTEIRLKNERIESNSFGGHYNFELGLVNSYSNIPSGNIFEIQFTLSSGEILSAKTEPVYFTD